MPIIAGDSYGQVESLMANRDAQAAANYFNTVNAWQRAQQMAAEQAQSNRAAQLNYLNLMAQQRQNQESAARQAFQFQQELNLRKTAQETEDARRQREFGLNERFYNWQMSKPDEGENRQKFDFAIGIGSETDIRDPDLMRLSGLTTEQLGAIKPLIEARKKEKISLQESARDYVNYLNQPDPTGKDAASSALKLQLTQNRQQIANPKHPYFQFIVKGEDNKYHFRPLYNFQVDFGKMQGPPLSYSPGLNPILDENDAALKRADDAIKAARIARGENPISMILSPTPASTNVPTVSPLAPQATPGIQPVPVRTLAPLSPIAPVEPAYSGRPTNTGRPGYGLPDPMGLLKSAWNAALDLNDPAQIARRYGSPAAPVPVPQPSYAAPTTPSAPTGVPSRPDVEARYRYYYSEYRKGYPAKALTASQVKEISERAKAQALRDFGL